MDSHEIKALIKALESGDVQLKHPTGLRVMIFDDAEEWTTMGQVRKFDRWHCIERGRFEDCLKALIGEEA